MGYQTVDLQQERIKEMQTQFAMQQAQIQQDAYARASALQNSYHNTVSGLRPQSAQPVRTLSQFNLQGNPTPTFEELNDEGSIYNMPIQTAVDLAINKFGSSWFKDKDTQDALDENTDFWLNIMAKLVKAGHLVCQTYLTQDKQDQGIAWKILDTGHGNR